MSTLFTARRRAEELAAAVDGELRPGAQSAETQRLLEVVTLLREQDQVAPRPEFSRDLRSRLMAEAEHVLTPENVGLTLPARPRGKRERRLVAAASAVVLVGGTAGIATASQSALPGEALYPIKRGIERAETGLSLSQAGRGHRLLDQAKDRLTEVKSLLAEDPVQAGPQVPRTLEQFRSQALDGSALMLSAFEETRDPGHVREVRTFAADGVTLLEAMAEDLSPDAQDELRAAAIVLRDIDERATAACTTCATDLPDLELPSLVLVRSEVDRALEQAVPGALDNSHPVVVPKGTVDKPRDGSGKDASGGSKQGGAGNGDDSGPQNQAPGVEVDPDLPAPDGSGDDGPAPGEDLTKKPKKVVEDLTDGLTGTVETLLPETGSQLDDLLP